jgi:hypothetical protein
LTGKRGEALAEALPALFYFERSLLYFFFEDSRLSGLVTDGYRNKKRRRKPLQVLLLPLKRPSYFLFSLFTTARNHEEARITQKESGT